MRNMRKKKVKCTHCEYPRADLSASTTGWVAYECGNKESPYHKCLLNIDMRGTMLGQLVWTGCTEGKEKAETKEPIDSSKLNKQSG